MSWVLHYDDEQGQRSCQATPIDLSHHPSHVGQQCFEAASDQVLLLPDTRQQHQQLTVPRACDAIHYHPRYGILKPSGYLHLQHPDGAHRQEQSLIRPHVVCQPRRKESFTRHIVLACIVMWFLNPLFGVVALYLAVAAARGSSYAGQSAAQRLGRASATVSLAGLLSTLVITSVVGLLVWSGVILGGDVGTNDRRPSPCHGFSLNGVCYSGRRYVRRDPFCKDTLVTCCRPYEDFYDHPFCYDT